MLNLIYQRPYSYGQMDWEIEHILIILIVVIIYFYFRNRNR